MQDSCDTIVSRMYNARFDPFHGGGSYHENRKTFEYHYLPAQSDYATGKQLTRQFDISLRTIQKDIDTLTLAGIPIVAEAGSQGGCKIRQTYKAPIQFADKRDYDTIASALHGLNTA